MSQSRNLIALLTGLCLAGSGVTLRAADAPAAKPAQEKPLVGTAAAAGTATGAAARPGVAVRNTVIPAAIAALTKEYKAHLKDPKTAKARDKSNYFKENPSPEVTPESVLKGLETSVTGGPAVEAYVKWQLLSGVPGRFPDDLAKRAAAVYRNAPLPPYAHPGLDRRNLTRAVSGMKKEQVAGTQKQFDEKVAEVAGGNEVFIAYRNELNARMPQKIEAINAGLEDISERASRGLNANALFDAVGAAIRSWSLGDAKPGQAKSMAGTIARLKATVSEDDVKPYTKLDKDAKWAAAGPAVDVKKLDDLVKFLESGMGGTGGLKFKDDK
jgi:hypothetical protein